MRSRLLIVAALLLVGWSIGVAVLRYAQIRWDRSASTDDLIRLRITSFAGSGDVPQPSDEWPSARAAWEVYQAFRRKHPDIALDERPSLRLTGAASESAVLMSMAGRTAGDIIAVNYRVLENWVDQDFLYPLDEYVIALARTNLANAQFIEALPPEARPPAQLDLETLSLDNIRPQWVGIEPAVWETIYRADRTGQRHVWAWPNELHTLALYYNRAIFAERAKSLVAAGLDPNRAPRTWEELLAYSKTLTDPATGGYGLLLDLWGVDPYQRSSVAHLTDLLWQAGAPIVEQDRNRTWHFVWDRSVGTIDTLRFVRELMAPDHTGVASARYRSPGRWNDDQNFGSMTRSPAMVFDFSSSFLAVKVLANPETLGIAPLPAGPVVLREPAVEPMQRGDAVVRWTALRETQPTSAQMRELERAFAHPTRDRWLLLPGGREVSIDSLINFGDGWRVSAGQIEASMFGITRLTTDPARRAAAWKYLQFLSSPEARRIRTSLMVEGGMAMFLHPQLLREGGNEDLYEAIPTSWRTAYEQIGASGRPSPNGANCQYLHQVLARMVDGLLVLTPPAEQSRLVADEAIRASWRDATAAVDPPAGSLAGRDALALAELARESRDYAERRLLNRLPEAQQHQTKRLGLVVVATIAVVFPLALWRVVRNRPTAAVATLDRSGPPKHLLAIAFMSMAVGSILIWQYYPLARGALMAFQDYRVMESETSRTTWVGLRNFAQLFTEPTARTAAINTLLFVGLSLGIGFLLPIGLAILLDEIPRGTLLFRVLYYLPAAMGGLIVAYLWMWLFNPQPTGWLNQLIRPLVPPTNLAAEGLRPWRTGLVVVIITLPMLTLALWRLLPPGGRVMAIVLHVFLLLMLALSWSGPIQWPVRWLTSNPIVAMVCVIVPGVWAGLGPGCIIYLAALKAIPEEVYEAADLDGAGVVQKVRHITIPYLKPLIVIQFVGAVIASFRNWEGIFVMTGGGPKDGTLVVGMEVWYNAFAYLRFGYATALAWVLGALLICFTVMQLRVLRGARFTTAGRN